MLQAHRWDPDPPADGEPASLRFCRLACLDYETDDVEHRRAAAAMLDADPALAEHDLWTAATAGRADAVERMLAADPSGARTHGGPHGWSPLFHLVYARPEPVPPPADVLRIARALLAAGADPHEGYYWRGLAPPFTLLTGAFGEGERGPEAQPRHPYSLELAELLLDAGADPNDGQTLYNRMFGTDDDHLRLLFDRGLGRGDGGPWRRRLAEAPSPRDLVHAQLSWAVTHDQRDRVALLLAHGADPSAPFEDGRTPAGTAALHGNAEILALLRDAGAAAPDLDPADAFVAAVMRGDAAAAGSGADDVRRTRPGLLVWAAGQGRADGVRILLDLGFDADARGRSDTVAPGEWETGLHAAVWADRPDIVTVLLDHGADPSVTDARFAATPLGWAGHLGRPEIAALLRRRGITS